MVEGNKSSLKAITLAVQQHKDKKQSVEKSWWHEKNKKTITNENTPNGVAKNENT